MGIIIIVLAILAILTLVAYLKFPPPHSNPKLVGTFDMMVMGVCALLCLVWVLHIKSDWAGTPDEKWWVFAAIAGAVGIEMGFLLLCFLLRNFYVFKPPRRPGGGGIF